MTTQYVSKEKLEELKTELETLKTDKRIEVGKRLKKAKELGDLSENSEYFEAREEQAQVETRISQLEDIIKNAQIITKGSTNNVSIGSTVLAERNGKQYKFTIVGANETDPAKGYISNESPLGMAFLGKEAGEKATAETPSGNVSYKIVSIE
ncbi:transcription elongation factor GreA [Candidatus Wolfebacteria bacterium]|nr:transcription elongation factor GreA [Candidatus Wolfebacteria bacterium]